MRLARLPDLAKLPPVRVQVDPRNIAAQLSRMNTLSGQGHSALSMYLRHGQGAHSERAWWDWREAWDVAATRALVPGALNRSVRSSIGRLIAQCERLFGTCQGKGALS